MVQTEWSSRGSVAMGGEWPGAASRDSDGDRTMYRRDEEGVAGMRARRQWAGNCYRVPGVVALGGAGTVRLRGLRGAL